MVIAIVERYEEVKETKPFHERFYITRFFKDILEEMDILMFPVVSSKNIEKVADFCDGLIVTGSCIDIHPKYYGEESLEKGNFSIDEYQEISKVIDCFVKSEKPILGICGGLQDITVYFGGSLYQDIANHDLKEGRHNIKVVPDSFLYEVYQKTEVEVNSYHHQAVKRVPKGFSITAVSGDGVIEAIEKENIVGVQWHLEEMKDKIFFQMFVEKFLVGKDGV